jgi:hypothetical protein
LLLAYNQGAMPRRLRAAVRPGVGAAGDRLLDDASSDRTPDPRSVAAATAARIASSSAATSNLGITGHYNRLEASCGELLITPPATTRRSASARPVLAAWDATGSRADLISSHLVDVDAEGVEHGVLKVDEWRRAAASTAGCATGPSSSAPATPSRAG